MESRIHIHPDICNGRPVIAGTRIPVQTVMEFLGSGDSIEEVIEEYPSLNREDIYACMQFAARLMANHYEVRKIAGSSGFCVETRSILIVSSTK